MKRALPASCLAAALGLLAACSPSNQTVTSDSATGNAAGAADTVGVHQMLAKDAAGMRLDSASTKSATGLGGTGNATSTGATSPQGK